MASITNGLGTAKFLFICLLSVIVGNISTFIILIVPFIYMWHYNLTRSDGMHLTIMFYVIGTIVTSILILLELLEKEAEKTKLFKKMLDA